MLKDKIKKIVSVVALGALITFGAGAVSSMATTNSEAQIVQSYGMDYSHSNLVKEMLDAGYIDQAKADNFNNNINSESTQMEIDKTYDLFLVDLNVKEGYYSAELGELGKLVIEAEYSVDGLSEELYNRYMDQLEKEGFLSYSYPDLVKEMLDAGYIDQAKADNFNNNINSESTQMEIDKTYDLFLVNLNVKEGYCSAELGELEKQLIEADYADNDALYNEIYVRYMTQYYLDSVKELLSAGYIDQAKADNFNNNINSESTRMEIDKTYGLFVVDLNVKEGYYSAELGELEKQVIEAENSVDGLSEELYNRYMDQLEKEGFLVE
ncbi:hypothetical protein SFBM_0549 [Candidatus Arthromitus sp. SFB-mouse-Japan]|uniref:hypothetical protein n=1 Tax=Candidatus Arthromitus sp. SFB-mouse TaxID=49118 RepID=UPI00021B7F5B|nr:hypothetical protein [Candidatus Arthromitus sp. SFB-mouse]EIA30598.1 hypothetical protein SFBSU_006G279 [Candidatus Arthromitus sp. SFB-mouse-SU]BAK56327.1 hypothetical protein SFBM_0549 [Candidatus Arthromitus sp. SFB-mouse-Japan]BAK79655.1 hypothetical protein MOUSESFB_0513 [Candidatus Arthromitus sp. SFB-mouse-Yit]